MDVGMKTEFKVKLTPKAVYSQIFPMPTQLEKDLIVELALMHKYGINTVLLFSKNARPTIAEETQRQISSSCESQEKQNSDLKSVH